jgi:hypothetical protein
LGSLRQLEAPEVLLPGLLAQAVGTYVLHPVCIGLFVVMLICWFVLPRVREQTEGGVKYQGGQGDVQPAQQMTN